MPTFTLGQCSMELAIEPLEGALAPADRQLAWQLYLALVSRPGLRSDQFDAREVLDLVASLRSMLEHWPAAQIAQPKPGQLGYLLVTVIEMVLLPCLRWTPQIPQSWDAVRHFCDRLARDVARVYKFPDVGANVPKDLIAAWQKPA